MNRGKEFAELISITRKFLEQERDKGIREFMHRREEGKNESETLGDLTSRVKDCQKCKLGRTRTNLVFGAGNPQAELMFVGEGPGFDEDRLGLPFVGKAGQLLTKIIESINLTRNQVYISNIVKCHPMRDPTHPEIRGNDRPPTYDEVAQCLPILFKQIGIIEPKIICTLGAPATRALLNLSEGIGKVRGKFYDFYPPYGKFGEPIKVIPTYHPAYLLRDPTRKKEVWEDMKKIKKAMTSISPQRG
ncbi:MAG: uracil-DNA glycosylase [Elusimicrobiota bacterium]|nr:uracil-DNA glycosylase [Elusimicrobiota bacterium]